MSHHIIFGSREWPIPERLPTRLVAHLSVGDQRRAFIELLGEEGYRALCDWGATMEDAAFLWRNVEKLYGIQFRRRADIRIHRQAEELAAGGRQVQAFGLRLIAAPCGHASEDAPRAPAIAGKPTTRRWQPSTEQPTAGPLPSTKSWLSGLSTVEPRRSGSARLD